MEHQPESHTHTQTLNELAYVHVHVCAQKANVPTVPGSEGLINGEAEAVSVAASIGFPIMIKATAGGGGRGMRLCPKEEDLLPLLKAAQQEAEAAFGNGAVYMERAITNPRHIEFQVRAGRPAARPG